VEEQDLSRDSDCLFSIALRCVEIGLASATNNCVCAAAKFRRREKFSQAVATKNLTIGERKARDDFELAMLLLAK
jgi:hypothetical protein